VSCLVYMNTHCLNFTEKCKEQKQNKSTVYTHDDDDGSIELMFVRSYKRLKVRITFVAPSTGKPEQQRFTMRSCVLTSFSSRQRSAISSRPLPERTDFGPAVCS